MHSLQDLLDLTDPEHRFVTLSQCAVAAALEVPSYAIVELLNTFEQTNPGLLAREIADDLAKGAWRDHAIGLSADVPPRSRDLVGLEICTASPIVEERALFESRSRRRMDALLDLLEAEFCCYDVQDLYLSTLRELDPDATSWINSETVGYARKAAGYLSWVHPVVGVAADFGLSLVRTEEGVEADAEAPVEDADTFARLLVACRFALDEHSRRLVATKARASILVALPGLAAEISREHERIQRNPSAPRKSAQTARRRRQSMLGKAACLLEEWAESEEQVQAPNMVKVRLSDALHTLKASALSWEIVDALRPPGSGRVAWNESNWWVASQESKEVDGDTVVVLRVAKYGEHVGDTSG